MLRAAVVILVIMLVYAGVYSLMSIIAPRLMVAGALKAVTEKIPADAEKVLKGVQRNQGLYALTTTISGFFVLFAGYRKAQKWAWYAFLVVGGIAWLWGLVFAIVTANVMDIFMMVTGMILFLVGLLLPIKEFFGKAASESKTA